MAGDVGGALGRPGVLDQDFAVGVGEGDGAGVPDRDDRGAGQVAVDQERDAADVDGAVAADGQLALSGGTDGLVPTHPAPCDGVWLRGRASWGDGGGVVVRSGCLGHLGGVPGLLRGDAPGQALVGALGVVDEVEAVYLLLKLGDGGGQGLLVQVAEQGLVETLVLALGVGVVGLGGDGLDPQGAHVLHQASGDSAPAGIESDAVVGHVGAEAPPGRLRLCRRRRWLPGWSRSRRPERPPPGGSGRPGAGAMTTLRPAVMTYSVASSCQQALGAG